jgi:hypothetical protein
MLAVFVRHRRHIYEPLRLLTELAILHFTPRICRNGLVIGTDWNIGCCLEVSSGSMWNAVTSDPDRGFTLKYNSCAPVPSRCHSDFISVTISAVSFGTKASELLDVSVICSFCADSFSTVGQSLAVHEILLLRLVTYYRFPQSHSFGSI